MSDQMNKGSQEELTLPLKILCLLIPLAGAIMYFVWKDEHPLKSKGACRWALIGLVINTIIVTIITVGGGLMINGQ